MNRLKHILLILALVSGTSLTLSSCGDDEGSDATVLDGLWEITEIEPIQVEADTTEGEEDTSTSDGTSTEGDTDEEGTAGAGSPPTKAGEDNGEETANHLGYIRFDLNTYAFFTVVDEKVTTLSAGTYQLSGTTLSLSENENVDLPIIALVELKNNKLTMTIDEMSQIWHAQKMADDPYLNEEGDGTALIDFESEVHSADSVPGSLMNPDVIVLNESISGTLDTLISKETYKAEQFYYLKVDTAKTYQLTVQLLDPEYDLPIDLMEYVQVWLSYQPYENNYKAEDHRIESDEVQTVFNNIKSPTGYLYIRLFSYQSGIEFELTLAEENKEE